MANSNYTKAVSLKIVLPPDEARKIKSDIQKTIEKVNLGFKLNEKTKNELTKQLTEIQEKSAFFKNIKSAIAELKKLPISKERQEAIRGLQKRFRDEGGWIEEAKKNLGKVVDYLKEKLKTAFKDFLKDIGEQMLSILNNIASSFTTKYQYSSKEWETYSQYGLSGAQGYAMRETMSRMNVSSLEDLYKMIAMNPEAESRFTELFAKYEQSYEQNKETAEQLQEFQEAWTDFKEELVNDLLKWFAANKETIKTVLNFALTVFKNLADIIGGIVNYFTKSTNTTPESSDIVQNYVNNNRDTKMTNSFNYYMNGANQKRIASENTNELQRQLAYQ